MRDNFRAICFLLVLEQGNTVTEHRVKTLIHHHFQSMSRLWIFLISQCRDTLRIITHYCKGRVLFMIELRLKVRIQTGLLMWSNNIIFKERSHTMKLMMSHLIIRIMRENGLRAATVIKISCHRVWMDLLMSVSARQWT